MPRLACSARGRERSHGAALAAVFAITWLVLSAGGEMLARRLGTSGLHVLTRVLGILLAALAVQYVLDGLSGYIEAL